MTGREAQIRRWNASLGRDVGVLLDPVAPRHLTGDARGPGESQPGPDLRDFGLDALDSDDPTANLPTVLSWSLRHITDEQRTVSGCWVSPPALTPPCPPWSPSPNLPQDRARMALPALEESSLVERRPHGRYAVHDLVRDCAATTARDLPDGVRETALVRVTDSHLYTAFAADRLLEPNRQLLQPDPPAPGVHPHRCPTQRPRWPG